MPSNAQASIAGVEIFDIKGEVCEPGIAGQRVNQTTLARTVAVGAVQYSANGTSFNCSAEASSTHMPPSRNLCTNSRYKIRKGDIPPPFLEDQKKHQ
jgi:hypothetical protein